MPPSRCLLHLLAAAILSGCASAAPLHDGTYPLTPRQTARLTSDTTLTYDSVSDSRCPPDVRCIWAGQLAFHFIVDGPDGREELTLTHEQPAATPRALHGARITLDPATIPPARAAVAGAPQTVAPGNLMPITVNITTR